MTQTNSQFVMSHQRLASWNLWIAFLLTLSFQLFSTASVASSALDRLVTLDIPPNTSLEDALIRWGTKTGMSVMINTPTVATKVSKGLHGTFAARTALSILLNDSGLSYTEDGGMIRVVPTSTLVHSRLTYDEANASQLPQHDHSQTSATPYDKGLAGDSAAASNEESSPDSRQNIAQVVVTAQKREERLQDTPVPVAVVDTQALETSNQLRLQDYVNQAPSVTITPGSQSSVGITIRGITTGQSASVIPTVGISVDDIPFGSSLVTFVPDLDPGDLNHIEVLRGPQGTLYGASSMGGLIKYVTVDPSTDHFSGRVEGGVSSIHNGAELGFTFRGSVNLPIDDNFGIRLSGFTRRDPGFIDNPIFGINGINEDRANGGRLTALWRPAETLSVKLSALSQDIKGGANDYEFGAPGAPNQYQQNFVKGVGPYDRRSQNYGIVVKDSLGVVEITSVTGYSIYSFNDSVDVSAGLGRLTNALFGVKGVPAFESYKNSRFSQELRFAGSVAGKLEWLAGGYYDHESVSPAVQNLQAIDPITGTPGNCTPIAVTLSSGTCVTGQFLTVHYGYGYKEYAAFADLTYHVTDRFDIQLGGRQSHIADVFNALTYTGLFPVVILHHPSPYVAPELTASSSPFTYLLTPRFSITPDLMIYARLASGYRPGGANAVSGSGVPAEYQPDKTKNYEIGAKADFLNHMLSVDTSIYYIDWKQMQLALFSPDTHSAFTGNAGGAKSEGVELQVDLRPTTGLDISSWFAWSEAVITSWPANALLAGTYATPGDRLPYSPRISGNISVNQEFPLGHKLDGFVGGTVNYVGERLDNFAQTPPAGSAPVRSHLPPYAKLDLLGGVKLSSWTATLYVNNATNRRGLLTGPPLGSTGYFYIQPRLIGLTLQRKF